MMLFYIVTLVFFTLIRLYGMQEYIFPHSNQLIIMLIFVTFGSGLFTIFVEICGSALFLRSPHLLLYARRIL